MIKAFFLFDIMLSLSRLFDLVGHPRVSERDAVFQEIRGFPAERVDLSVTEVAELNANGALDPFDTDVLTGDLGHGVDELVDRDVLRAADIHGTLED